MTGAGGQLGQELVRTLTAVFGEDRVVASDIDRTKGRYFTQCPFEPLNVFATEHMETIVQHYDIKHLYHLAAVPSADGERDPMRHLASEPGRAAIRSWRQRKEDASGKRVFWPSSIAVFGAHSPLGTTPPQHGVRDARTVHGIAKAAGELWCQYYHGRYGLDVRCLRYPGLDRPPLPTQGRGTTDYAVDLYHRRRTGAIPYTCHLAPDTRLPVLYMPDAIKAALQLMKAPKERIQVRSGYNLQGMSVTPSRDGVAASNGSARTSTVQLRPGPPASASPMAGPGPWTMQPASNDWGWAPKYDLDFMSEDMLMHLMSEVKGL